MILAEKKYTSILLFTKIVCSLVFVFILISISTLYAKQPEIDSLKQWLKVHEVDSQYINVLNHVAYLETDYDISNAEINIKKAIEFAKKINFQAGEAEAYRILGICEDEQGQTTEALENYLKSLEIFEKINNKRGQAYALNDLGILYKINGKFDQAKEYYIKALKIREEIGDQYNIATSLNNIGDLYESVGDLDNAMPFLLKSLELKEKLGNKQGLLSSFINIGILYQKKENLDLALQYCQKALKQAEELGNYNRMAEALNQIGIIYILQNKNKSAIESFQNALIIASSNNNKYIELSSYENLYKIYAKQKDFKTAFNLYGDFVNLKDTLFSNEKAGLVADLQSKFEIHKRDNEIKLLNADKTLKEREIERERVIIFSMSAGLILIIILAIVLMRNNQLKKKNNRILEDQKMALHREKEKSDNLLLNILPEQVAFELKEKGAANPKNYDLVSILFTDFVGFTQIASHMTPSDLVKELNQFFHQFDSIASKNNLEKIKTIGDSYMCAGGIPAENVTNPVDAVRAALQIRDFMNNFKADKISKNLPFWEIRIGIHSGPIVAGVVGSRKFAYDIWGDAVNLASRMESNVEPMQVNISGDTYNYIKDTFICEYRGKVNVKNKGEVDMYYVMNEIL